MLWERLVTGSALAGARLRGLPSALARLGALRELRITADSTLERLPAFLGRLTALERLYISVDIQGRCGTLAMVTCKGSASKHYAVHYRGALAVSVHVQSAYGVCWLARRPDSYLYSLACHPSMEQRLWMQHAPASCSARSTIRARLVRCGARLGRGGRIASRVCPALQQ